MVNYWSLIKLIKVDFINPGIYSFTLREIYLCHPSAHSFKHYIRNEARHEFKLR